MSRRRAPKAVEDSPPPGAGATDPSYFTEIEGHFALRRGTPFVVSAKDWALMKEWGALGIPLPIVIEAIDAVFDKNESSGRRKVISSLGYCRHAVKELWNERKELSVGAGVTPEESPGAALDQLAVEVEGSGVPAVARFADAIRSLAAEKSVPRIEERLIEIEREIIDVALGAATPEERTAIGEEIARMLGDTSKLDEKTRARTEEANRRRIVRDRFGVPRLTLFR